MLRPLMLDGVGGEIHGADIITVDERALGERTVELRQELSYVSSSIFTLIELRG